MKITFLSWRDLANPLAGGSEVYIDRLAVSLMELGHEVKLLCGGPIEQRPYEVVDTGGTYSQYLRSPLVYRRFSSDADLLVDTENGIPFFSPLWRKKPVLGLFYHLHSDQWSDRFPPPVAAFGRFLESTAMPLVYRRTPFLAISDSTADDLASVGIERSRITVLPVGVDQLSVPLAATSPEPLFVCFGRLMPHKRVDLLLRAWERVRPVTGGTLVIAGDGPERETLERAAGSDVEFVGRVTDEEKWELLSKAWLLLHPAHHEGWGIVIIEAAEAGTTSLGFRVPGVQDAIVDGESGLLADSEDDFVKAWTLVGTDRDERDRLALGAKRRAAAFEWPGVAKQFMDLAETVVAEWHR
jgi:glycosyltransferase involved in cell wall biosynthesis